MRSTTSSALIAALILVSASSLAQELRDPMRPPQRETRAADVPHESGPVLSAVFARNGTRTAIFNGKLVRAGSVVGPYTIEAVLEDGVRYRHESLTRELHLARSTPIKKPAAEPAREASGVQR